MKKILVAHFALLFAHSAITASIHSGSYDASKQSIMLAISYCYSSDSSTKLEFTESCRGDSPATCNVSLVVQGETANPNGAETCVATTTKYDVAQHKKSTSFVFQANDGSEVTVLVEKP